ncbi:hypothetical protein RDABS01_040115, partial [Bienertia sinuspersici]
YDDDRHLVSFEILLFSFPKPFFFFPFHLPRFYARIVDSHFYVDVDDPKLLLKSLRQQCKLGFTKAEHALPLYCHLGRVDLGFSVLAHLIKLCFRPNIVTFTTLINGLVHTHHFDHAVRLLDKIVKLDFQPTLVTYGTMFKGLCSTGNNAAL